MRSHPKQDWRRSVLAQNAGADLARPARRRRAARARRSGVRPRRRRPSSSSTPERRSAAAISTGRTRGGAVVGLEREGPAVGQRHGVAGLGAGLADRAGDRGAAARARRAGVPETYAGCCADRVGDPALRARRWPRPARGRRGPARSARSESSGAPQPSTATCVDRLAGQLGEGRRRSPAAAGGRASR